MTLQDLEVLSNQTAALSGLVSQVMVLQQQVLTLQQGMTHVVAELATLRQGHEHLEAFLRQKFSE
jgi:hypothetical protein